MKIKLNHDDIQKKIKKIKYIRIKKTQTIICSITLENGFNVTGQSSCISPQTFNKKKGKQLALKDAEQKIWELEAYLLKQTLYIRKKEMTGYIRVPPPYQPLIITPPVINDRIYEAWRKKHLTT